MKVGFSRSFVLILGNFPTTGLPRKSAIFSGETVPAAPRQLRILPSWRGVFLLVLLVYPSLKPQLKVGGPGRW